MAALMIAKRLAGINNKCYILIVPTYETRVLGMTLLFTVPTAVVVENYSFAPPVIFAAIITGFYLGNLWHVWRTKVSDEPRKPPTAP